MLPFKIIWLAGMPRSGTNWLSQIFDSHENVNFKLSPLFSYAFKNAVDENSSKKEWLKFFDDVYHSNDAFLIQTQKRAEGIFPTFNVKNAKQDYLVIKETRNHHLISILLKSFPDIKVIYLVRNPCGAINSWLSSPKEFPQGADPKQEWRTGKCRKIGKGEYWGFEDWKLLADQYLSLEKEYPNNVKVVSYENLVDQSLEITNDMFEFAGLSFSEETNKFLFLSQTTHSEHTRAVFKSKEVKDKWKTQLDPEIANLIIQELTGTNLEKYIHM
jgi:hypothetical protein